MARRMTTTADLEEALRAAGFEPNSCAHRDSHHTSWEYRPQGDDGTGRLPLFAVHLSVPSKDAPRRGTVAHCFAFQGSGAEGHHDYRFDSLTQALDWAVEHGRTRKD